MHYKYLLPVFLFLIGSGTAAMIYQIIWIRLSTLSVGATSFALSIVIGAFFLGLGLGSFLSRYFNHQKRPILITYGLLEITIAFFGLALLPILFNLDGLIANVALLSEIAALKFILITLVLLLPTTAMGATLPLISTLIIQETKTMGQRYAQVYSLNTFGAVVGALLCSFILVPNIGLDGAIYTAVVINIIIALTAIFVSQHPQFSTLKKIPPPIQLTEKFQNNTKPFKHQKLKALGILFITGFVSIATEIGWSKYLIIFTGSTLYGFSTLIAIFLFSLATGAWLIRHYLDRIKQPALWLGYALLSLSALLVYSYSGLSYIPSLQSYLTYSDLSLTTQILLKYIAIFALISPPSFLFGALFPLALLLYTQTPNRVQTDSSTAFTINTLAGILGSIVAGFWLIPQFGTAILLLSMAGVIALVATLFLFSLPIQQQRLTVTILGGFTFALIIFSPPLSYKPLLIATFNDIHKTQLNDEHLIYIKEAKSGVIGIIKYNNPYRRLINNGLSEARVNILNHNHTDLTASLLGIIPYLLHTNPKTSFVIGFGGGITPYALTQTPLQSIKVVELEPEVINAIKSIYPHGLIPALTDHRVNLTIQDARHELLATKTQYDIIISQPSHPWLSGASNLFTREFFQLTYNRLNSNGIYSQWVNLFKMDTTTLKAIIKSFNEVYPHSSSFIIRQGEDLILIGSKQPIEVTYATVASRLQTPQIKNLLSPHNITTPHDLAGYRGLNRFQMLNMTQNAISNTQSNIITEVRLSHLRWEPSEQEESPFELLEKWFQTPRQ